MKLPTLVSLTSHLLLSSACLLEVERHDGHIIDRTQPLNCRQAPAGDSISVGTGDRFNNGALTPLGLGTDPSRTFSTVYNTAEIKSAVKGLCREFNLPYFEAPYKTYENRTIFGFKLGGPGPSSYFPSNNNNSYTVLLQSSIHTRERGGPDHLLNFASDLLYASRLNTPLHYGGSTYPPSAIHSALAQGIIILPLVNPDGVAYDQATNLCWRKNRNPASSTPSDPNTIGVDLNRNFSPVWNFTKYMHPSAAAASADPSFETFCRTGPLSEAENEEYRLGDGEPPKPGVVSGPAFCDPHGDSRVVP